METMATGTQSILFLLLCSISLSDSQDVRMPPSLVRGPTALIYYKELANVTLHCEGVGIPAPTYEWTKNGQPLNVNAGNIRQMPGLGTIVIYPIVATDQGYYQCILTNSFGKTMSNMTYVQMGALQGFPPYIQTEIYTVDTNGNICLRCDDGPSVPASRIYWSYNFTGQPGGSPIEVTQTTKIQTDPFRGDLCFTHVQAEDTGKVFICSAKNGVLDRIEAGSYSTITTTGLPAPSYAPFITFGSAVAGAVVIGLEGEAMVLRAFFSGSPIPSLVWRKNGQTPPQDRWSVTNENTGLTLTSGRLIASDAGEYTCQGSNNIGSAMHTIQLTIHARPLFVNNDFQPHDMNVTDGDVVTVKCDPYAIPNATVTWFKDNVMIAAGSLPPKFSLSADSKNLTITGVCKSCYAGSAGDLMNIQCNASNEYGYGFAQGYINVLVATQITSVGGSRVWTAYTNEIFECQATSDDSTPVVRTWYFNEFILQQSATVIFGVDGSLTLLMQNETDGGQARVGQYICVASNGVSSGQVIYTLDGGNVQSAGGLWWIGLLIGLLILLLLLLLLLVFCCRNNEGASYPVDKKERKNGNNPEKELKDIGFQNYMMQSGDGGVAVVSASYGLQTEKQDFYAVGAVGGGGGYENNVVLGVGVKKEDGGSSSSDEENVERGAAYYKNDRQAAGFTGQYTANALQDGFNAQYAATNIDQGVITGQYANNIHQGAMAGQYENNIHLEAITGQHHTTNIHQGAMGGEYANDIHLETVNGQRTTNIHQGAIGGQHANNIHLEAITGQHTTSIHQGAMGGQHAHNIHLEAMTGQHTTTHQAAYTRQHTTTAIHQGAITGQHTSTNVHVMSNDLSPAILVPQSLDNYPGNYVNLYAGQEGYSRHLTYGRANSVGSQSSNSSRDAPGYNAHMTSEV